MDTKTLYVGIDVSKLTLDVALTVDGNTIIANTKINNDKAEFKSAVRWITKHSQLNQCEVIHCCIESTGIYSDAIVNYLQENTTFKISVINPAQAKAYGSTELLRAKTDKVDAGLLSRYAARVKPDITTPLPKEIRELRVLIRHLEYLISRRAQEKTHLESITDKVITKSIKDIINHYDGQIEKLQQLIKEHLDNYPDLKERIDLLKTIPGIGETTATILICELHSEDNRGKITTKAQIAHAGLAPRHKQSGTSVRGKSNICKTGNSRLRKCLYFPAIVATRKNPVIKEFYHRLLAKGKLKMVAIVAAMRKLLAIAIGVLNNKTAFDPNWSNKIKKVFYT
jgi:transposase